MSCRAGRAGYLLSDLRVRAYGACLPIGEATTWTEVARRAGSTLRGPGSTHKLSRFARQTRAGVSRAGLVVVAPWGTASTLCRTVTIAVGALGTLIAVEAIDGVLSHSALLTGTSCVIPNTAWLARALCHKTARCILPSGVVWRYCGLTIWADDALCLPLGGGVAISATSKAFIGPVPRSEIACFTVQACLRAA